jgi:diguanylate cyclase (GGDEF)-like protein
LLQVNRHNPGLNIRPEQWTARERKAFGFMNNQLAQAHSNLLQNLLHIRPGTEMGQAFLRFSAALILWILLIVAQLSIQIKDPGSAAIGITTYLVFAFLWIGVAKFSLFSLAARRILSIVLDQLILSFALVMTGEIAAAILWAPVVVSIGNGLRYGSFYAKLSCASGVVFMGIALMLSPYWRTVPFVSAGLLLSMLVIPWYAIMLSERIARDRREIELRAAEIELASKTDSLTGILNRSGFVDALDALVEDVKSHGTKGAVMLLNLDGFKEINDAYGHLAGDEVLKEVAARLEQMLRVSDKVARIGGDEFGVVVRNLTTEANVKQLAQKILHSINAIRFSSSASFRLGASIGICFLPASYMTDSEEVIKVADELMRKAKKSGKNQFKT